MLDVSTSGYYAWLKRPASKRSRSDAELIEMIKQIHTWSRETYGVPRMREELIARGQRVNPKRIARLMRTAGLAGISRRKGTDTTRRERDAALAPDLVSRNFTADGPNQLWLADLTYGAPRSWRQEDAARTRACMEYIRTGPGMDRGECPLPSMRKREPKRR